MKVGRITEVSFGGLVLTPKPVRDFVVTDIELTYANGEVVNTQRIIQKEDLTANGIMNNIHITTGCATLK